MQLQFLISIFFFFWPALHHLHTPCAYHCVSDRLRQRLLSHCYCCAASFLIYHKKKKIFAHRNSSFVFTYCVFVFYMHFSLCNVAILLATEKKNKKHFTYNVHMSQPKIIILTSFVCIRLLLLFVKNVNNTIFANISFIIIGFLDIHKYKSL